MNILGLSGCLLLAITVFGFTSTASAAGDKNSAELMTGYPVPQALQVTAENWLDYPNSNWSFWNLRQLLPTRVIARGAGPISRLEQDPTDLLELRYDVDGTGVTVHEMLAGTDTNALVVLHQGRIVTEKYYHGMTPESPHLIMSLSKSLVGTLIGNLVDQDLLDTRKPAGFYIPELKGSAFEKASVRQLLDMSVAADRYELTVVDDDTVFNHMDRLGQWRGNKKSSQAEGIYEFTAQAQPDGEHGKAFNYSGLNTEVLAWLAERVTGKHISELFSEQIWSKLGAEQDAYVTLGRDGTAFSEAGFNMTARDLARVGQMVLQKGNYNGQQIVGRAWVEDLSTQGSKKVWRGNPKNFVTQELDDAGFEQASYRSQWYSTGTENKEFFCIGYRGQSLWIDPSNQVVIVKFSGWPEPHQADFPERWKKTWLGFQAIAESLGE